MSHLDRFEEIKHLGSCHGAPADLFFPPETNELAWDECRKVCAGCPIRRECLEVGIALYRDKDTGCWGGTSPKERRRLNRQRKKAA